MIMGNLGLDDVE